MHSSVGVAPIRQAAELHQEAARPSNFSESQVADLSTFERSLRAV